jgi:hypothetical protein
VATKVIIRLIAPHPERMRMTIQTWCPKRISKSFSIFFERHVDQEGQTDQEED